MKYLQVFIEVRNLTELKYFIEIAKFSTYLSCFIIEIRQSILGDPLISWIWGSEYELDVTTFLPTEIPYPEFPISLNELAARIPTIDSFYPAIEPALAKFLLKVDEIEHGIRKSIQFFKEDIKWKVIDISNLPSMLPEDYNPPKYVGSNNDIRDLNAEKELHTNISNVSAHSSFSNGLV